VGVLNVVFAISRHKVDNKTFNTSGPINYCGQTGKMYTCDEVQVQKAVLHSITKTCITLAWKLLFNSMWLMLR